MAKISVTIETSSGAATYSAPDVPDAAFQRAIDYWWRNYTQDEPRTPLAEVAAFRDWARDRVWNSLKNAVVEDEKKIAARAAKDAVGDIEG